MESKIAINSNSDVMSQNTILSVHIFWSICIQWVMREFRLFLSW